MRKAFYLVIFLLVTVFASATHNRAGEITYEWLSGFTYKFTVTTYTKDSAPADRCELTVDFGDGNSAVFVRNNGASGTCSSPAKMGEDLPNDVRKNVYSGTHSFQAPGYYTISMQDLNRNGGINNIPNSINIPFYITTTLLVDQSVGTNSSPTLNYPPIDNGCTFKKFIHNPSAFDPDGDSLYYSLINCKGLGGADISETYDPLYIQDPVTIDSLTGNFVWDTPQNVGQFNFAILIQEYRKGSNGIWRLVGAVTRDFQVDIQPCQNQPPVFDPVGPFCVIAGDQLQFVVSANDPDQNNIRLTLEGYGGPFETNPAAIFPRKETNGSSISQQFTWNTTCNLVRSQSYYAQFIVEDQPVNQDQALTDIMSVEIRVIAPAPTNLMAATNNSAINLSWNQEICIQANGYDIYRRENNYGYSWDTCETGVPAYTGYVYHASTSGLTNTTYTDSLDLKVGVRYCYMVVATFPDGSESIASEELCAELPKFNPVITNVDVLATDVASGQIDIRWTPPREFDSATFPPPYSYVIERAEEIDGSGFVQVGTTSSFFDTVFTDQNLDTETKGYNYQIALVSNGAPAVYSDPASSIFLKISALDKVNFLQFNHVTPWQNDTFVVFRENTTGVFDSIGFSTNFSYLDTGLTNGQEYCYRALGIGAFSGSGLPSHLLNNSQINCATPTDTVRPCAPILSYTTDCEARELTLSWTDSIGFGCVSDIVEYRVYYKEKETDPWPTTPVATLPVTQTTYIVTGDEIVGCYGVTAVDDATPVNESYVSSPICLDGCPIIVLPNVFTPNSGNSNLFFKPILGPDGTPLFRDIDAFTIEIFNRWGGVVYSTNSPLEFVEVGWTGQDMNTGADCADGVYYYLVNYTARSTQEQEEIQLKGFVHLFR